MFFFVLSVSVDTASDREGSTLTKKQKTNLRPSRCSCECLKGVPLILALSYNIGSVISALLSVYLSVGILSLSRSVGICARENYASCYSSIYQTLMQGKTVDSVSLDFARASFNKVNHSCTRERSERRR